jgi:hypothetical protein
MTSWTCHAHPASLAGKPCGHVNETGKTVPFQGRELVYCGKCGCTKIASEHRRTKETS